MLLTIDIGNTNTVLGVFRGEELIANWRLTTARQQTVDEYGVADAQFVYAGRTGPRRNSRGDYQLGGAAGELDAGGDGPQIYVGQKALFVEAGVKTGMSVLVDNPLEVGADPHSEWRGAFTSFGGAVHRRRFRNGDYVSM